MKKLFLIISLFSIGAWALEPVLTEEQRIEYIKKAATKEAVSVAKLLEHRQFDGDISVTNKSEAALSKMSYKSYGGSMKGNMRAKATVIVTLEYDSVDPINYNVKMDCGQWDAINQNGKAVPQGGCLVERIRRQD